MEGLLDRQVEVLVERPDSRDRRKRTITETVASATWRHAEPDTAAPALTLSFQIRFFRGAVGGLCVLYGHGQLGAPRYDLALLGSTVLASPALETSVSAEQERARSQSVVLAPRAFWAIILASAVVLALLIARLVRREGPST